MDDDYFDALRRMGTAWEAYSDAAGRESGDTESARCSALWAQFEESFVKLKGMRASRRRG
jgi:hypothetical protein